MRGQHRVVEQCGMCQKLQMKPNLRWERYEISPGEGLRAGARGPMNPTKEPGIYPRKGSH